MDAFASTSSTVHGKCFDECIVLRSLDQTSVGVRAAVYQDAWRSTSRRTEPFLKHHTVNLVSFAISTQAQQLVEPIIKSYCRNLSLLGCCFDQDGSPRPTMMVATTKLLVSDLASEVNVVPPSFVRPISNRPNLSVVLSSDVSIPLIDLHGLYGHRRSTIINQIATACKDDGFFQVKNHGVPEELMGKMIDLAREFFRLPESERMKSYSDDPRKTTRLSTSFNVKTEKVSNWRDFLRLHCYPLEDYVHEWPTNPPSFRKEVEEYCTSVRGLVQRLLEAMSESLGLERGFIWNTAIGKHGQHMAMNYYPSCPQPELTYGLPSHTDPNLITVLLQDHVPGLQVYRNGNWVAVNPIPKTFVINIGDQMQVLSNDAYKSVLHRAVVNNRVERISIPTFYCPSPDALIGPAKGLIDSDRPAVYRDFTYAEYYEKFWNKGLESQRCLDMFKATT